MVVDLPTATQELELRSPHVPTRPEFHAVPAQTGVLGERVVGAAALGLAASLAVQNAVVIAAGAPDYAASVAAVLAFHAEHRGAVSAAIGLEALNLPLLLVLLAGLHGTVRRRGGAGADWSRVAVAAGAALAATFALYAVLWAGVVLSADGLAEPSSLLELTWRLHAAAFALALPALGTTFAAAALAAGASGLTPAWQAVLGVGGGGLLVVAGSAGLAIADGSPLLFVGMPGYAAWLVWLLATGVRLVRTPAVRPAP